MRVAFLGTGAFGLPALEALIGSDHQVVGVVTGPDKRSGRGRKSTPTIIKAAALDAGLPILTPNSFRNREFLEAYTAWKPDVAIVVAFRILPRLLFDIPTHGTLNIHPSKLPLYRGPAPIPWALMDGVKETAVSIFRITEKVDAGGLLLQSDVTIDPDETTGSLSQRLAPIGGELTIKAIDQLEKSELKPLPQDDNLATKARKLVKEDGLIDWNRPAIEVHNLTRGVTPWPGAQSRLGKIGVKFFESTPVMGKGQPGEIIQSGEELVVACGDIAVAFRSLQREGKRRMTASELGRGFDLSPGKVFKSHE